MAGLSGHWLGEGRQWRLGRRLGGGSFGTVYEGVLSGSSSLDAAVKVEDSECEGDNLLCLEVRVARLMSGRPHSPNFYGSGVEHVAGPAGATRRILWMAMELLGRSLEDVSRTRQRPFGLHSTFEILAQGVEALEQLHDVSGHIHRDVKPGNLMIGRGDASGRIYLIDFGLARRWRHRQSRETESSQPRRARTSAPFRGSLRYASYTAHKGLEQGRMDDLWALLYVSLDLGGFALPWLQLQPIRANLDAIGDLKKRFSGRPELLLQRGSNLPPAPDFLAEFPRYLRSLGYHSRPDYDLLYANARRCQAAQGVRTNAALDWQSQGTFSIFSSFFQR